jgi:hypothetical protein
MSDALPQDDGLAGLGIAMTRMRTGLELELLAAMTTVAETGYRTAVSSGIRSAIFQDEATRLIFDAFTVLDSLRRFTGDVDEDRFRVFRLVCHGLETFPVGVQWVKDPNWGCHWSTEAKWRQLTCWGQWSASIVAAMFVRYLRRPAPVTQNAAKLIEFHQRTADGIRHIAAGRRIIVDQLGRFAA